MVKQFIYADSVNVPEHMIMNGRKYLFIKDHRGSVNMVVDSVTGEIKQQIKYSEFGEVLQDTNPGFQPFGFAGGLYDYDTKLVRFGARDYDGKIGRWLSKDPIGFDGGDTNLYGYVMQDPINLIDPTGLFFVPPPFVIVPIDMLPKPSNPNPHEATVLEKSGYLLHLDNRLPTQKLKDQNFDNYWDNVILKKKNNYDHLNCSGI
jgi:RHS repeat-associated protein